MNRKKRCAWVNLKNELYRQYHDNEWGVPVHNDKKLFEMLILEGAQAGLSWETVLEKRENYRKAFDDFDPEKIAKYGESKKAKLLQNESIIRNRLKIKSAIQNPSIFKNSKRIWQFRQIYLRLCRKRTSSK